MSDRRCWQSAETPRIEYGTPAPATTALAAGEARAEGSNGGSGVQNPPHLEHHAAHVLLAQHALLGGPLEGRHARVLDLVEVLHALGHIGEQVGADGVGAKRPDLLGQILQNSHNVVSREKAHNKLALIVCSHDYENLNRRLASCPSASVPPPQASCQLQLACAAVHNTDEQT